MRKGEPKSALHRVEGLTKKRQQSIVGKCHPAFFEIAPLWKETVEALKSLGPNPPAALAAMLEKELESRLEEIQQKYSGPVAPAPNTFAAQIVFRDAANEPETEGVTEWFHFQRHRTPMKNDLVKRNKKNWSASQRVLRTVADLERIRCGQTIQPFKGDSEHLSMFVNFWGFGLEKLSPEELCDVFDRYCPCDCKGHDPDALKKQRNRFRSLLAIT